MDRKFIVKVCVVFLLCLGFVYTAHADGPLRRLGKRIFNGPQKTTHRTSYKWTVSGGEANVQSHLSGWPHYQDTTGWTHHQRMNFHDQEHDRIGPVSGQQVTKMNVRQVCRGGNCPAPVVANPVVVERVVEKPVFIERVPKATEITPEVVESRVREEMRGSDGFRRGVRRAIRTARQSGQITPRQAVRLRTAMMSPAFAKEAQTLAVTQMSFSGGEGLEQDENGNIVEAAIDWDGFASFLERILPLLVDLLIQFGLGG